MPLIYKAKGFITRQNRPLSKHKKELRKSSTPLIMHYELCIVHYLLSASLTWAAQATVIPTIGLLPLAMNSPFFFCISFFAQKTGFFEGSWLSLALCGSIRCRKKVENY